MMKILKVTILIMFLPYCVQAQSLIPFEDENGKYGYKNDSSDTIITAKYDWAFEFTENIAAVNMGCEWGWSMEKGNHCAGGLWGYIDETGKELTSFIFNEAYQFKEGFAVVHIGDYGGGFSGTPEQIDSMKMLYRISNGYTLIDKQGKQITKVCYDDAFSFREGMALVKYDGKYGYIDTTGNEIISMVYEQASNFKEGKAKVILNGREFFIDKHGQEVQ